MFGYNIMQDLRKWWQERQNHKYVKSVDPIIRRSSVYYTRGIPAFFLLIFAYQWVRMNKTELITRYAPTDQNKMMFKINPMLNRNLFQPTFYLPIGLLQWLYTTVFEQRLFIRCEEQQSIFTIPLHNKTKNTQDLPIFLVVAGAMGLDNSVISLLNRANAERYRTICVLPEDYYDCNKLYQQIQNIKNKYPNAKIFGAGFDYGANLIVNCAAEHTTVFDALISIANPLDIAEAERNFHEKAKHWWGLENKVISGLLKGKERIKDEELIHVDERIYNVSEENALQLKKQNSSIDKIHKLTTRTLFIQSIEDPLSVYEKDDPRLQNDKCIFVWTRWGGHSEWFFGLWADRWLPSVIMPYCRFVGMTKEAFRALH